MTFIAEGGQDLTVRPVADRETGRTLVEIAIQDLFEDPQAVRLSPGIVVLLTRAIAAAGFCAELVNVASGKPSTMGE
ncbi:hypothetical protein RM863_11810 [Streptomyces sp. DSM 41014]|uniref:Uncharacterized protein n=1 Tax=Streptomyces hintoniae TaxID=3075521 RepID=A0ABU2UI76_9ACTN|nr:hypothetical protein [Streptomyces sp. DSM 41014]MDT0472810.1 hypothetical protein [Streptomyces sp. DSM 41014]